MTGNYVVRPYHAEDAERITKFAQHPTDCLFFFPAASFPLSPATLQLEASRRHRPTVAMSDGLVVGYANFIHVGATCSIGNLIVAPDYRRKGVADSLLLAMEMAALTEYGAGTIAIGCFRQNLPALHLFKKRRYCTTGERRVTAASGNVYELVLMEKHMQKSTNTISTRENA